jgi:very-short-patch-repair endonuclease
MRARERVQRTSESELATIAFGRLLVEKHIPVPIPEYRFDPSRRWRFDLAWPEYKLALEVDGGIWIKGRHTRGKGWLADTEKLNAAAVQGWRMLRCTPQQLATPDMIQTIREAIRVSREKSIG